MLLWVRIISLLLILSMAQAMAGPNHLAPKSIGFDEDSGPARAAYRKFYAHSVEKILRQLPDGTCVSRSFALANRLMDQGIRAMVMIKTVDGEPHFWVETEHGFILDANPGGRKLTKIAASLGHKEYMVLDKKDAASRDKDYLFHYEHGQPIVKWGDLVLRKILHVQTRQQIVYADEVNNLADESKAIADEEFTLSRNITRHVLQRMPAYLQEELAKMSSLPQAAWPLYKLRAQQKGCSDLFDYYRSYFLDKPNASEISWLKEVILDGLHTEKNRTSWLFRDSGRWVKPLQAYVATLLPLKILAEDYSITVKSIGASHGGEAYSIGIVLFDTLLRYAKETLFARLPEAEKEAAARQWLQQWNIRLQGFDNDFGVLQDATQARYSGDEHFPIVQGADETMLEAGKAWLEIQALGDKAGTISYRVHTAVKACFVPAYIDLHDKNLLPILHQEPAEIIFCRNVIQYIDESLWDDVRNAVNKSRSAQYPSFSFLDIEFLEQGKSNIVLPVDFRRSIAQGIKVRDWTAYRALVHALITILEQRLLWTYRDDVEKRLTKLKQLKEMPVDILTAQDLLWAYGALETRDMLDLGWKFLDKAIARYEATAEKSWDSTLRSDATAGMAL